MVVELTCEKYKEKFRNGEAFCGHPEEYCKFRQACVVNFITREREREERRAREASADNGQPQRETRKNEE